MASAKPVTVLTFTPPDSGRVGVYLPAPRREVTVHHMCRDENDTVPDYALLPEGAPETGGIVLFRPPKSRTKYDRITLDCRRWLNRSIMYDELREALHFQDSFEENLDGLLDALCASSYYITLLYTCVPLVHMKHYFIRVLRVMNECRALEGVYGEDVRDYPESYMEVDFGAGDSPHRPFRNPPRAPFDMPPPEELW